MMKRIFVRFSPAGVFYLIKINIFSTYNNVCYTADTSRLVVDTVRSLRASFSVCPAAKMRIQIFILILPAGVFYFIKMCVPSTYNDVCHTRDTSRLVVDTVRTLNASFSRCPSATMRT